MFRPLLLMMRRTSTFVADAAARPSAQLLVLLAGVAWLIDGGGLTRLASVASIGSLVLTQMVLNQQRHRELALQMKIDELILSKTGARNEVAGLEHRTAEEIEDIRAARSDA